MGNKHFLSTGGRSTMVVGSFNATGDGPEGSISTMTEWTLQYGVFAYDTYVRHGKSGSVTLQTFHRKFDIPHHGARPTRKTILCWLNSLRTRGSFMKKKKTASNSKKDM